MTKIKMYHAELPNMGDLLNVLLVKEYFGQDMKRHTPLTADLSGIGSGLGQFTLAENNFLLATVEKVFGILKPTVHIWGTGFIENKEWKEFYHKNMIFDAVRGKMTKAKVEQILGKEIDVPLGDGGILAPKLIEKGIEKKKKYKVSVIPHFKEQDHIAFQDIAKKFGDAKIINLKDDPHTVIKDIAQSEIVISSSLHGLIVADAFRVPNYHIVVTDKLLGDGFKFNDYYSAYDLEHKYTDVIKDGIDFLTEEFIHHEYEVTDNMVDKVSKEMEDAFPFKKEQTR